MNAPTSKKQIFSLSFAGFNLPKHNLSLFVFLLCITIARNGFSVWGQQYRDFNKRPGGEFNLSRRYFLDILFFIGNNFGGLAYFLVYSILLLLVVVMLFIETRHFKSHSQGRFLFLLALLPGVTVICQRFGSVDTFIISCGILGTLTSSVVRSFLYALIMIGVHAEGAVVSAICLALLTLVLQRNSVTVQKAQKVFILTIILIGSALSVSSMLDSNPGSRVESVLFVDLKNALAQIFAAGLLIFIGWFGSLWYFVGKVFGLLRLDTKVFLFLAVIVGGGISCLASDGTRVAAVCLTPFLSLLLNPMSFPEVNRGMSRSVLFYLWVFPAINISNFNFFLPFHQILHIFGLASPLMITL